MKHAQISFEYLLLIGFAIAILLPGVYYLYTSTQSSSSDITGAQYTLLGEEIVSTARKVMSQGTYSWLTVKANLPDNVIDIQVDDGGRELVILFATPVGQSSAVFFADSVHLANGTGGVNDSSIFVTAPHGGRTTFRLAVNSTGSVRITEWMG